MEGGGDKLRVGVLGFGTVGSGVIEMLLKEDFELKKVLVRDVEKERDVAVEREILTQNANEIINSPDIDVVIEAMGGAEPAFTYLKEALINGKHIITANKVVICERGRELFEIARRNGKFIGIRGTFVGCHSLIHDLSSRLKEGGIRKLSAILNGTTNFILTKMEEGMDFNEALRIAQDMGYAERDPSQDVNGTDTFYKLSILLGITANTYNFPTKFPRTGIEDVRVEDIRYGGELGYRMKLLGKIELKDGEIYAEVTPAFVRRDSILGSVFGEYNGVEIEDEFGMRSGLIAPGAGRYATAQAILKDLYDIARGHGTPMPEGDTELYIKDTDELERGFYLRFMVVDKPGVLAQISGVFGRYGVSISAVIQKEAAGREVVPVVMLLYPSKGKTVKKALEEIDSLPIIKEKTKLIPIEG